MISPSKVYHTRIIDNVDQDCSHDQRLPSPIQSGEEQSRAKNMQQRCLQSYESQPSPIVDHVHSCLKIPKSNPYSCTMAPIRIYLEKIDTTIKEGRLHLSILSAFAEYGRELIRERLRSVNFLRIVNIL